MASELGARGGAAPADRGGGRSRRGLLRGASGLGVGAALGAACGAPGGQAGPPERAPVTLDFLSHWATADLEGFQKDADDYRAGGASHVTITSQTIPYAELRQKTLVLASSGTRPDLYATYALWLREFQRLKLLAGAPGDAAATIKRLYSASLVEAVTSEGKVLGFPRDPNTYLLLYGKQALRQAGVARPPRRGTSGRRRRKRRRSVRRGAGRG